jgi:hypothetical protein
MTPQTSAAADPLAGLRDWHLPEPVSWWPPAPGWWLLALLGLALGLVLVRWWLRRRRDAAPMRAALAELAALRARVGPDLDARTFAAAVSRLLRRLALVRYPRDQVASLSGGDWIAFLERSGPDGALAEAAGRLLADGQFRDRPADEAELAALVQAARSWIRAQGAGRGSGRRSGGGSGRAAGSAGGGP